MLLLSSPVAKPALVAMPGRGRPRAPAATVRAAPGAATMYELLSVAETAGSEEIKAAYRRQARRWHPDACRTAGDEGYFAERFMRAREAYEVLSDQGLRREYDRALLRSDGGEWERQLEGAAVAAEHHGGAAGDELGQSDEEGPRVRDIRLTGLFSHIWKAKISTVG